MDLPFLDLFFYYYYSDYLTNYLLLWSITSLLTSPSLAPYIPSRKECLMTLTKMVGVGVFHCPAHRSIFTITNRNMKGLNVYSSSRLGTAAIYEPYHSFFHVQSPTCHQDVTVTWTLTILIFNVLYI